MNDMIQYFTLKTNKQDEEISKYVHSHLLYGNLIINDIAKRPSYVVLQTEI